MSGRLIGDTLNRALPLALNKAVEERIRNEKRQAMQRRALNYLDAHCDNRGRRLESGMTLEEFAAELGVSRHEFADAVMAERRRRKNGDTASVSRLPCSSWCAARHAIAAGLYAGAGK